MNGCQTQGMVLPPKSITPATTTTADALARFRQLRFGMAIEQGRAIAGLPRRETGSGISIDVYRLHDGSEVWVGYGNNLQYVKHGDADLIEPSP